MDSDFDVNRRAYLATVGTAGMAGIAGCPVDGGSGNGDGTGDGDGVVVPATAADFPPFEYTENGPLVGFDVELAEAVIDRAGYETGAWVDIRFDALVQELNADQFDLIGAAMSIGLGRREAVAFSTPYYETDQSILVRSDGEFQPERESDLEGRPVGAQAGTTSASEVDRLVDAEVVDGDDYRRFVDYTRTLEALADGDVEAVVVDRSVRAASAERRDVEVALTIETDEEYALAMRRDDDRLEDIDEALGAVLDDGTYDELVDEYLESPSPPERAR